MREVLRVGAVDCGTNSIRLLVADVDVDTDTGTGTDVGTGTDTGTGTGTGTLRDVLRRMEVVRLGYGVDRTGRIDPAAMARTLTVAREYAAQCSALGATGVRFVATSASRDASNADQFVAGVREAFEAFGTAPEVVSGVEEARLSFRGATGDLVSAGIEGPYLVVDLGGGSTEFVRGTSQVEASLSVDIGCVRMTERHLASDPPTSSEIAAAVADIDTEVDRAAREVGFAGTGTLVGLAGTVTTVTAHVLGLDAYDPLRIHLAATSVRATHEAAAALLAMTRAERAALAFMHPGRVDVIGAGALVWDRIIDRVARDSGRGDDLAVVVSEHDILDGIALSLATP